MFAAPNSRLASVGTDHPPPRFIATINLAASASARARRRTVAVGSGTHHRPPQSAPQPTTYRTYKETRDTYSGCKHETDRGNRILRVWSIVAISVATAGFSVAFRRRQIRHDVLKYIRFYLICQRGVFAEELQLSCAMNGIKLLQDQPAEQA